MCPIICFFFLSPSSSLVLESRSCHWQEDEGGGHKEWRQECRALKDALNVETVNAAVGRVNPTALAGNYSQHSVLWEGSQDAEVMICGPPTGAAAIYLHLWLLYKLHNTIMAAIVAECPPCM